MPIEITIDSNFSQFKEEFEKQVREIVENANPILFAGASGILALVSQRIHVDGKRANGSAVGQYANSYLRIREKNNRGADRKIILSLTRQMENDFTVVEVNGNVGLGFNNQTNFEKATFMEARFPGTYFISAEEEQVFIDVIDAYINGLFE